MQINRALVALLFAALVAPACKSARADFAYTETTQVTGGSLVSMMKMAGTFSKSARQFGQPVESTVIVKGNRMTHVSADRIEIIDLDKGTITQVDPAKHQYTVMTFEQMRQRMEEAMARSRSQQAKQPTPQQTGADVKFRVSVRATNTVKNISGLNARDTIMVLAMDATDTSQSQTPAQTGSLTMASDLWLVPDIPGYQEVRDFHLRMAERLGSGFGASAGAGDMTAMMRQLPPGAMQGVADMAKEMSKIKGVPVQTVMRMGTTVNGAPLPAASEAPLPPDAPTPTAGDLAKQGIANSLHLGGFGLGRKKAADPQPQAADPNAPAGPAVMMETNTQLSSFSSNPVDPSKFEVPAGYKQVEVKDLR